MVTGRTNAIVALILCWVWCSCAQVGAPSGGPTDNTPPALLDGFPEMGAVNVQANSMTLEFDEYVKTRNLGQQLLVSPPLERPLEAIVRGRQVELTWDEDLKRNTTYVFQFGDGIVDVNEGNAAKSLIRAFSTGPDLDTLKLAGRVVQAVGGAGVKGCRVMLYPAEWPVDSVLEGVNPWYVASTNEQGRFEFQFLPLRAFRCLAVLDDNRNYQWDAGESVALGPDSAVPPAPVTLPLRMDVTSAPRSPYLSEAVRDSAGVATWKMSESMGPLDSLEWISESAGLEVMANRGNQITAWPWTSGCDSIDLRWVWHQAPLWPKDLWTTDTVDLPAPRLRRSKRVEVTQAPPSSVDKHQPIALQWSVPMVLVDGSGLMVKADSVASAACVDMDGVSMEMAWLPCEGSWPEETELMALPGAFGRAGQTEKTWPEDTLVWKVKVRRPESLSEWRLSLSEVQCQGQLEVLNASGNRVSATLVKADTTLTWSGLTPGSYRARWWADLNQDEVWNGVDVAGWRTPEPMTSMDAVELRSNWVVETAWALDSSACSVLSVQAAVLNR